MTGIAKGRVPGNVPQKIHCFVKTHPKKLFACHTAVLKLPMDGFFVCLWIRAFKVCFNGKR
jgi:hypothetical protein